MRRGFLSFKESLPRREGGGAEAASGGAGDRWETERRAIGEGRMSGCRARLSEPAVARSAIAERRHLAAVAARL
ncbi:MAG: hypothetical protein HDS36_00980 [Bacteroides sp.]|nr:hypothetical protein [Bacteroides sp.]